MRYLPGAGQMKNADQYTIQKLGVSSLELMERAALSCVQHMQDQRMDMSSIGIVCGSGNNGGDGFAIGRILKEKGHDVIACMAGNKEHCTQECEYQMRLFENAGGIICNQLPQEEYSIIVDALFGVGLSRSIEGRYADIIEDMNKRAGIKFAVDIPSGISADTGSILGTAFRADHTVTFQTEKFGMEVYPGKEYAGKVIAVDIGISQKTMEDDRNVCQKLEKSDYRKLLPIRKADSNKGSFGKVLVIAGSKGMSGAAYLNAKAAYMAGAGLVQIYTPEENRQIIQQTLPEAIVTTYREFEAEEIHRLLLWSDVVCIGSGIGMSETSRQILRSVLTQCKVPCVVDADGLNLLSEWNGYENSLLHKDYILTPHMKEMSRLVGLSVEMIKKDRIKVLSEYTDKTELTCVLKDSRTVTASKGQRMTLNTSGNPAMAKAGSGDVLAGVITGFLAQGLSGRDGAVLGTYIHGRAGDYARDEKGCYSVMAQDIIFHISTAIKELTE